MTFSPEPVSFEKHKDLKIKRSFAFGDTKSKQFSSLNADEFSYASTCYPILFIKDRTTGKFFPIALFGLDKDENIFYSPESWSASYIPGAMSLAPLSIGSIELPDNQKKWVACLDVGSESVSSGEGEALFDKGEETDFLKRNRENLGDFHQSKLATMAFVDRLAELRLLKSIRFDLVYEGGEKRALEGMYSIDEEMVKNLAPEVVQDFYEKGYLPSIYAQMSSKHNLYELIKRKRAMTGDKVVSLQVVDQPS